MPPLEFNGLEDSLFQAFNLEKEKFMEYVEFHGIYSDIPLDIILKAWDKVYGVKRVKTWIRIFEKKGVLSFADFESEDVLNE